MSESSAGMRRPTCGDRLTPQSLSRHRLRPTPCRPAPAATAASDRPQSNLAGATTPHLRHLPCELRGARCRKAPLCSRRPGILAQAGPRWRRDRLRVASDARRRLDGRDELFRDSGSGARMFAACMPLETRSASNSTFWSSRSSAKPSLTVRKTAEQVGESSGDEAVALLGVRPFHGASGHRVFPSVFGPPGVGCAADECDADVCGSRWGCSAAVTAARRRSRWMPRSLPLGAAGARSSWLNPAYSPSAVATCR